MKKNDKKLRDKAIKKLRKEYPMWFEQNDNPTWWDSLIDHAVEREIKEREDRRSRKGMLVGYGILLTCQIALLAFQIVGFVKLILRIG